MPATQGPAVATISRPPIPHFTDVPAFVREHFEATGKRISWQPDSATQLSMSSVQFVYPVQVSELPAELVQQIKQSNLEVRSDDRIHRGDCVLCIQNQDVYDQYQDYYRELHRQQTDPEAFIERYESELQRLSARTGRRTGRRLVHETPESRIAVEDQIVVSKQANRAQNKGKE